MIFYKIFPGLYTGGRPAEQSNAYLIIPEGKQAPDSLPMKEAFSNTVGSDASFVFFPYSVGFPDERQAARFKGQVAMLLQRMQNVQRAIFWMSDPDYISDSTVTALGISIHGNRVFGACTFQLTGGLAFQVVNDAKIKVEEEKARFETAGGQPPAFAFRPDFRPGEYQIFDCFLSLDGDNCGRFSFSLNISLKEFIDQMQPGMEYLYTDDGMKKSVFAPLFPPAGSGHQTLSFEVRLDPCDIRNRRREMSGTMEDYAVRPTVWNLIHINPSEGIPSFFESIYGAGLFLLPCCETKEGYPARFTFSESFGERYHRLCPEGDFRILGEDITVPLLCGLNGTEFFEMPAGGILRFLSGLPAFAPKVTGDKPEVGKADDPDAPRLSSEHRTSWVGLPDVGTEYVAQPKGHPFYGPGQSQLLIHKTPSFSMEGQKDLFFPMIPYAGVCAGDKERVILLEANVLSRERCERIGRQTIGRTKSPADLHRIPDGESMSYVTTPCGLLAGLNGNQWKGIYLASGKASGAGEEHLWFEKPDDMLIQAFQSGSLFLVAVDPQYIEGSFHNEIHLQDWLMRLPIGYKVSYGHYGGIMIVKGCKGALYDPLDRSRDEKKSLIANPGAWSYRAEFSSPVIDGRREPSQQQLLAQWLVDYFEQAYESEDKSYFQKFNNIAADPDWQGILFLRMPLDADTLPASMTGLLNGVSDPSLLCVHHLGISFCTVEQEGRELRQDREGNLFGLIYYKDPALRGQQVEVVPPEAADRDNFRLLMLKVLFRDSVVADLQCYAQISFTELFGTPIHKMGNGGNPYQAALLSGRLQDRDGVQMFVLENIGESEFLMDSNILNRVVLTGVNMGGSGVDTEFALRGILDFEILEEEEGKPMDLLSYGTEKTGDSAGLVFSNAVLHLSTAGGRQEFTPMWDQACLDRVKSRPRRGSLCACLPLTPQGPEAGDTSLMPEKLGYLTVASGARLSRLTNSAWFGLRFTLALGSAGGLAGKEGWEAQLLLAWNPASKNEKPELFIGIRLPGGGQDADSKGAGTGGNRDSVNSGEGILGIENVWKLSIGNIELCYDREQEAFMLLMRDVALKIFDILKFPPTGAVQFDLFGPGEEAVIRECGWYALYRRDEEKKEDRMI